MNLDNSPPRGGLTPTPAPSPTKPISKNKNSRKRNLATPLSVSEVLCSGEAMTTISSKKFAQYEESDTDIDSDDGVAYDSDCEDSDVRGEFNKKGSSSPISLVGAKVRRLELSGGEGGQMDVKKSLFSSEVNMTNSRGNSTSMATVKKRRVRGINTDCETREDGDEKNKISSDDISPRDATDFPFFADSSMREGNEDDYKLPPIPASPQPLSAKKKPPTRMMKSPPTRKGRKFERANSFLQMFSQESLMEDNFLHRPSGPMQDEECSIASPKRPMRNLDRVAQPFAGDLPPAPVRSSSFSRFAADFEVVGTLGNGSFGCVYKVRNRMDLRLYAIKAAKREARGKSDRDRMLQEVYALAALSDQTSAGVGHIVRYHQAWMEGNRLYIQTELCQSTLLDEMSECALSEKRRYKLLREILLALDCVHQSGMIHLDIKAENIFIKNDQYKLGDFGLVSKIENQDDVEEGDSRYMSMELLSGDLEDLTKSDIFSLGATLYEICLGRGLPENGQEWQDIRQGVLLPMRNTSFDLQLIITAMMSPKKEDRPTAATLLKKRQLLSEEQRQLIVERNKAEAANMALNAQIERLKATPRKVLARSNTIC